MKMPRRSASSSIASSVDRRSTPEISRRKSPPSLKLPVDRGSPYSSAAGSPCAARIAAAESWVGSSDPFLSFIGVSLLRGVGSGSRMRVLQPFGLLVPALAVADLGAQSPLARLGRVVEVDEDLAQSLGCGRRELTFGGEAVGELERALPDHRHRAPPAPVVAADLADAHQRDRVRVVVLDDRVVGEQRERVLVVLVVGLDDLELGEQEVGGRQGAAAVTQPVTQLEHVAGVDGIEEDVGLPFVLTVAEEQPVLA